MAVTTQPKVEDKWEIEEGARTLIKAEELKKIRNSTHLSKKSLNVKLRLLWRLPKRQIWKRRFVRTWIRRSVIIPIRRGIDANSYLHL